MSSRIRQPNLAFIRYSMPTDKYLQDHVFNHYYLTNYQHPIGSTQKNMSVIAGER